MMHEVKLANRSVIALLLIALFTSVFSTAMFSASLVYLHPPVVEIDFPEPPLYGPRIGEYSYNAAPPVNVDALNEIKHQIICPTCPQQPNRIVRPYRIVPQPYIVPTPQPARPTPQPSVPTSQPTPVPTQTTSAKCQIALFLDGSARSNDLAKWFSSDPQLLALKAKCTFEIYTADSPLYRARYAEVVPPSQFPAMVFQYSDGGHIHAAGKNMIPLTASALYSDMKLGYEKAQSVRTATVETGVVKSNSYSWDEEITPTMQLSDDCPDGICPPTEDKWRPGDKVRDLFDGQDDKGLVLWGGSVELVTYGLFAFVILLALAVVISKLGK
jgi:hypothetical protein